MGALATGHLSDRVGYQPIFYVTNSLATVFLYLLLVLPGTWIFVGAFGAGFFAMATLPLTLAMAQRLAPRGRSMVSSLMMGFLAEGLTEEITVDPEELAEARWFHREEVREMVARAATGPDDPARVSLPPPLAIAHQICRRWAAGLDDL